MDEQELNDLREFLRMVDFERLPNGKIAIVENQFDLSELPATVQNHLDFYFKYLQSIE